MMVGTIPTSVPQFILLGNWLVEMDFKRKCQQLRSNKIFWILSSLFLIHVIGLLYTNNQQAGWNDIRIKMPFMFLSILFFSTKPLSLKEFYFVLYCFLAGCVANTVWCLLYSFVIHHNEVVRNASRFMSHIRLGLFLNVAITICVYFIVKQKSWLKIVFGLLAFYYVFAMYKLGLASGLANLCILALYGVLMLMYYQKMLIKIASFIVLLLCGFFVARYILEIKDAQLETKNTPNNKITKTTPWGKPYISLDTSGQKENGNYVLINIQAKELKKEWAKRFPADSFSFETNHNMHRYEVLVRYLASKGLNKDSAAIAQLTETDLANIQKGIFNYQYPEWNFLRQRIYELVNEYDEFVNTRHVNGHSFTMRLYFWKAALHSIMSHPVIGVGTGDVQSELNKVYVETKSPLDARWYLRPHNQYLTITVALGIVGLIIFLASIIYPVVQLRNYFSSLFWPFFLIALISFFFEDTLETQAGLTFYAFFNSLYLSLAYFKKQQIPAG
jgi:O-antigen ligase